MASIGGHGTGGNTGNGTPTTSLGPRTTATSTHVPVMHLATSLPAATGDVPQVINMTSPADQRDQADEIFAFLSTPNPVLSRLNEGHKIYVAVVNVPRSSLVKVVYGMGFGTSPIGLAVSPVDGKLLFLHGDGNNEVGPPQVLCLPSTMTEKNQVATMTDIQFSTQLTSKGSGYTYPLLPRAAVTTTEELLQLAPIPAYLVYDGFENDLDAAVVLERVLSVNPVETDSIKHLKSFLRACLSAHNSPDIKPYVVSTEFSATATVPARQWAKQTFAKLFPTLVPSTTQTAANNTTTPDIAALIAAISAAQRSPPAAATAGTSTSKNDEKIISAGELAALLRMCGKASTGKFQDLPGWLQECNDKGNSESYKHILVQKFIMANSFFDDAEVPLTMQIIKMFVKRAWTGKDGNITRPTLLHAMEGLTPFAMQDLNEDEVAILNDESDLLDRASQVSVAELRGQQNKLKVSIPAEADDFMLMLKRFTNLLYAAFSETYPLFKAMVEIIRALKEFSREARKKMTSATKGSILWIVLLQARQFSLGEVNLLCEFTTMHEDLRAKRASILHSEMPHELLKNSSEHPERKKRNTPSPTHSMDGDKSKKTKTVANPNNWNPKLKAALEAPLKAAGNPSFTKVMNYCKKDAYSIFPKGSPVCVPNAFFGTCYHVDKCTKKHTQASDAQVQPILTLLDKFIKAPAKLKSGQ